MSASIGFNIYAHDRASSTLTRIGGAADRSAGHWRRLGTAAKFAGRLMGSGLLLAAGAGVAFAKSAAEDEKAARQLAIQMRNNAGATKAQVKGVEDWITKTSLASGVADDELRPALAKLVTVTKDVGKAQELTALAMDISAGSGKSLESVTSALQKAQNGSLGGLARLGVATKDAAGEAKTFEQVQKDLASQFKGQSASAAETTSGQYNRLKVMMTETGEAIGYKLLPYALKLGQWMLNTGIPAAQKFGGWLKDHLGPAISDIIGWFKDFRKPGGDASGIMDDLSEAADNGKRAWKALSPFLSDLASNVLPTLGTMLKLTAKYVNAMSDAGIWMWNNVYSTVIHLVLDGFANMSVVMGNTLKVIGKAPGMGWVGDLGNKLLGAGEKARGLGDKIRDIPERVPVTITVKYVTQGRPPANDGLGRVGAGYNPGAHATTRAEAVEAWQAWQTSVLDTAAPEDRPLTLDDLLNAGAAEQAKADKVKTDVAALMAMGLSGTIIKQLQSKGAEGAETLSLLASANAQQIAILNAQNAATTASYTAAGMNAATALYGAAGGAPGMGGGSGLLGPKGGKDVGREVGRQVRSALEGLEFKQKGSVMVAVLKAEKKDRGGAPLGLS